MTSTPAEPRLAPRRWQRVARPALLVSLVYVVLSLALYPAIWRDPATVTTCACDDPGLFMFWIGWMRWAIDHGHGPFVTQHLAVPDGVNALWNTSIPLPAALVAPITDRFGPVAAYNVLLAAGPALSAMTMYAALRRWARPLAAFAGGLVYGFSPFMAAHLLGHLHLTLVMVPPLLLLLADEILVRQRRSPWWLGSLFGLLLVVQLFVGEEVLALGTVAGLVGLVVLAVRHRSEVRARWRYATKAFGVAVVVFGAVAAGPVLYQFTGPRHIVGPAQRAEAFGLAPLNVVIPTPRTALHTSATTELNEHFPAGVSESTGYLGVPIVAAIAVAIVRHRRDPVAGFAAISAIPMAVVSFGPYLHLGDTRVPLPGRLLALTPVMNSAGLARYSLFTTLFVAIVVARLVDAAPACRALRRLPPRAAVVALAALLLVPIAPAAPFQAMRADIPSFFTSADIRRIPQGSVALVVPWPRAIDDRAMVWQAAARMRFRMPGGYAIVPWEDGRSHFAPRSTSTSRVLEWLGRGSQRVPLPVQVRRKVVADLRHWDVRTVVVGPMPKNFGSTVDALTGVLGRPPHYTGGVAVWYDVDPAALDG